MRKFYPCMHACCKFFTELPKPRYNVFIWICVCHQIFIRVKHYTFCSTPCNDNCVAFDNYLTINITKFSHLDNQIKCSHPPYHQALPEASQSFVQNIYNTKSDTTNLLRYKLIIQLLCVPNDHIVRKNLLHKLYFSAQSCHKKRRSLGRNHPCFSGTDMVWQRQFYSNQDVFLS